MRDATATITEVGVGTYDSGGWAGGTNKALRMGISPDAYDKTATMVLWIASDAHESKADMGMAGGTLATRLATRMDWTDPPGVDSFAYQNWAGGGSYVLNTTNAVGLWTIIGGKDYLQSYRGNVPYNNYYGGPHVSTGTIGEFVVGNSGALTTDGATKKYKFAGIFHALDERDADALNLILADFEAAL